MEVQHMNTAVPTPSVLIAPSAVVDLTPDTETTTAVHDGVIRTKDLAGLPPGLVVRAWLHGEPKGSERTVATCEKAEKDGSMWTVTFSSPHPTQTYKAAYRWYVKELDGLPIEKRARRTPGAHLTHQPFADLGQEVGA